MTKFKFHKQVDTSLFVTWFYAIICENAYQQLRARLIYVFKNWKLLFKNICENTCGWKSVWKCVKCCLKTENGCLKTQTKHPLKFYVAWFFFFFYQMILLMCFARCFNRLELNCIFEWNSWSSNCLNGV